LPIYRLLPRANTEAKPAITDLSASRRRRVELGEQLRARLAVHECRFERGAGDLVQLPRGEAELPFGLVVFALQRRPEIGRVVRVERHLAACGEKLWQRMLGKGRKHLQ